MGENDSLASVCLSCLELRDGDACAKCGAKTARTRVAFETWERARQKRRVRALTKQKVISRAAGQKLLSSMESTNDELPPESAPRPTPSSASSDGYPREDRAAAAITAATTFSQEISARWTALTVAIDSNTPPPSERAPDDAGGRDDAALEAGRAVFTHGASPVVGAGVDALAALDDDSPADDGGETRPLGALQVFWFLGIILVLAGSVMGVREAWRTLFGVNRQLVIGGALFVYHVLFVVLSRVLVKRSHVTGRVLSGIAAGLLPIAFVAVASAVGTNARVGIAFAVVLVLASIATLSLAGAAFSMTRARFAPYLALALIPSLILELPLAGEPTGDSMRLFAPLGALVPVLLASLRIRANMLRSLPARDDVVALAAATYGAIAVALFAVFGGPKDLALDLSFGTPAQLVTTAWLGLLAAIAWVSAAALEKTAQHARLGALLTLLSVAVLVSASCAGAVSALANDSPRDTMVLVPAGLAALAAVIVIAEQRRHFGLLHLVAPTSVVAVLLWARVFMPQEQRLLGLRGPSGLPAALVLVPAALLAFSSRTTDGRRRTWAAAWGVVSGVIILAITGGFEAASIPDASFATGVSYAAFSSTAATALVLALSAHVGGATTRPWLHVYGALTALVALSSVLVPTRVESAAESITFACAALGGLYGVLALFYPSLVKNEKDTRRPLDDVSLLFAVLGLAVAVIGSTPTGMMSLSYAEARLLLPRALPVLAIGGLLLLRAQRDASALATLLATSAAVYAVRLITNVGDIAGFALLFGCAALATSGLAVLRGRTDAPRFGRALFGVIPLPLGGSGTTLLDGPALASPILAALACGSAFQWIGAGGSRTDRGAVVFGVLAVIPSGIVAFGTRALLRFGARGHVATLAIAGAAIGLCAVSNRVGNPLPPAVVGRNLTVILVGVWLLARGIVRVGPKVGSWLGRPGHGPHYQFVPHAGVLALSLLLLVDAWLVGAPTLSRALVVTPPLLLLGGALGALLLYRSFGLAPALHVALGALLAFAAVAAAQHALMGPVLVPLDWPGGRWVPIALRGALVGTSGQWLDPTRFIAVPDTENLLWARALLGASIFVVVAAALVLAQSRVRSVGDVIGHVLLDRSEDEQQTILTALSVWSCIAALLLGLNLAFVPALAPAVLLFVGGLVLVLASGSDRFGSAYRAIVIVIGAPLVVHALAQQGATVPAWAGPAFAILPVGIAIAGYVAARRRERGTFAVTDTELGIATLVAMFYAGGSIAYALAARAPTFPRMAAPMVINSAGDALFAARNDVTFAPVAITLAALAFATLCTASTWRGGLASILGVVPPMVLSFAGVSAAAAVVFADRAPLPSTNVPSLLVYGDGAMVAATVSIAALVSHALRVVAARTDRDDLGRGLAVGRDLALLAVLTVASAFVLGRAADVAPVAGIRVGPMGVLGLGVAIIVSIDAAVREKTARHVMLVEILLVALYAFATRELDLRPEIHALLGLGYGFSLLGVAVIARRRNVPAVSTATRRFAIALPVLIVVLTASGLGDGLALLALGSSVLYGVMAMVEKSRLLGSLAAVAANVALLLFALAQGLDGIEIYVGPLGLLVTALAQLFAPKMNAQGRSAARIVGGMLLYLPAGLKLTLRLGAAMDGSYSVVFGAICLLGVVAGLVLQVRAYLVLGTLFITLDVISNLVYAGLRDHRVGFVLLSVSGLMILGIMIAVTLRREAARMLLQRIRGRFRAWD